MPALYALAMASVTSPFPSSSTQPCATSSIYTPVSIPLQTPASSTVGVALAGTPIFRRRGSSGVCCTRGDPHLDHLPSGQPENAQRHAADKQPTFKDSENAYQQEFLHNDSRTYREQLPAQTAQNGVLSRQDIINRLSSSTFHLTDGMRLHCLVIETGFELHIFEANVIVNMYGKFGALEDARSVFDHMQNHDVTSWNTLMSVYVHQNCHYAVLDLFSRMHREESSLNSISIQVALRSCVGLAAILEGSMLHHYIICNGLEPDISIGTSLVLMYGRCGALQEARFVFDNMLERDEHVWTSTITSYFDQGHYRDVLELYWQMQEEKTAPNRIVLIMALKACTNLADLKQGKLLHKYIMETAFAYDEGLAMCLIKMYGKCKLLDLAHSVFEQMRPRTLALYNAMIAACLDQEHYGRVLKLVQQMLIDGLKPDAATFAKAAQICQSYAALEDIRGLHSQVIKSGLDLDSMVGTAIVSMYARCGEIAEAHMLVHHIKECDLFTWNLLFGACVHHRRFHECIQYFKEMVHDGIYPDKEAFSYVLPSCAHVGALADGKVIHACIVQANLDREPAMGSCLINMYGKCGALEDARYVFDRVPDTNVIHWTSIISVYVQYGKAREALQFFDAMQQMEVKPNNITYTNVLNACASLGDLVEGQTVHACIKDSELKSDVGLANAILHMYCKCGALAEARTLFESMVIKRVVSWNVLIAAYIQQGHDAVAIELFQQMQHERVEADEITYVNVLRACASLEALDIGNNVHCCVVQRGLGSGIVFATTMISMYGACGALEEAWWVFDNIMEHNIVSWTAIISVYVQQGCSQEAIELFDQMRVEGWEPDGVTLVSVLGAYANLKLTAPDDVIQACSKCNFKSDGMLGNALINMYSKCGAIEDARSVFEKMQERNVSAWNAMISAYGQHGNGKEALQLLKEAQREGISPDELTWLHCLSICAALGALGQGKVIHRCIINCGYESNTGLGNALLNMYGKCGAMEEAVSVFGSVKRDVVSWNAILATFSLHGLAKKSVELFKQMQLEGTKPDEVTFLSVLSACSHAGLVKEGCDFFICMRESHKEVIGTTHYGCLIDLFGKSGHLDIAEDLIDTVPFHVPASLWMTLLGATRNLSDIVRGQRALDYVALLDHSNAAPYVLLSNIYATHGRWDDVKMLRRRMMEQGLQKRPGCSVIEVNNKIHSFLPTDRRHPDGQAVYKKLEILNAQLKEQGYVPDTRLALQDVDEERKKFLLCHHSERLALAFGLIKAPPKEALLIVKNLRMCADCHAAFKLFSIIVDRRITLRDASRFHCFENGLCSCGNCW